MCLAFTRGMTGTGIAPFVTGGWHHASCAAVRKHRCRLIVQARGCQWSCRTPRREERSTTPKRMGGAAGRQRHCPPPSDTHGALATAVKSTAGTVLGGTIGGVFTSPAVACVVIDRMM
jgi:hypothetical protein